MIDDSHDAVKRTWGHCRVHGERASGHNIRACMHVAKSYLDVHEMKELVANIVGPPRALHLSFIVLVSPVHAYES